MKILVITENVGRTSPGIVFERLIQGLALKNDIDLLTSDYDPSLDLSNVSKIVLLSKRYVHPRIYKLLISLFTINPFDYFWGIKALKNIKFSGTNYDVILCFMSFHHYSSIVAGKMIAENLKCKLAILSVDAVPAPLGWPENSGYRKGVLKMMRHYLSFADVIFSSNKQMLDYQLSLLLQKKNILSDIIYNPSYGEFVILPIVDSESYNFVYTGGIYGARKSEYILKGFQKLLKNFPDSNLIFVGTRKESLSLEFLDMETLLKIVIIPHTKDLSQYYNISTALIDIDADIENDVFISGKMTNYLMINRIIISETGTNSPSRQLFKNLDSVIQCDHNPDQLYEAMKKAIQIRETVDFIDRKDVLKLFCIENVIDTLNSNLKLI